MTLTLPNALKNVDLFLNEVFTELERSGLPYRGLEVDHICYRVQDLESYAKRKQECEQLGKLLIESNVNGRPIATYQFFKPIQFRNFSIPMIELPAPKSGKSYVEGFEHIEIVTNQNLDSLAKEFSQLNPDTSKINAAINADITFSFKNFVVKYHNESLNEVIAKELEERRR